MSERKRRAIIKSGKMKTAENSRRSDGTSAEKYRDKRADIMRVASHRIWRVPCCRYRTHCTLSLRHDVVLPFYKRRKRWIGLPLNGMNKHEYQRIKNISGDRAYRRGEEWAWSNVIWRGRAKRGRQQHRANGRGMTTSFATRRVFSYSESLA